MDRIRTLNYAEHWLRNGLEVSKPPAFFQVLDVDMSSAKALLETARRRDVRLTYTCLIVRATAMALARNPDLHVLVCGHQVHSPSQVDIGLSIAGDSFVAPVLVLEQADRKDMLTLAREIVQRAPEIRAADERMMQTLRRWGWIIPFAVLRRSLLRLLFRVARFKRRGVGTFQVSVLQEVDYSLTPMFSTSGILIAGRVRDSVIAVNGHPTVRPVMTLSCCADHRIWDGRAGGRILMAVRNILESGELSAELDAEVGLKAKAAGQ